MSSLQSRKSAKRRVAIKITPETMVKDRDVFDVLRLIRGKTPAEVSRDSGVSASTIAKWRWRLQDGGTRWPRHDTMRKVVESAGYRYALVEQEKTVSALPNSSVRADALETVRKKRKMRRH